MKRFSVGRSAAISHTFEADDGTLITPASVTATVTRNGSAVVSGAATVTGSLVTYNAGSLPQGVYDVSWAAAGGITDVRQFEIVGRHLFSVADLRGWDAEITASRFPNNKVTEKRDLVVDDFQEITGRSFVPRTERISWTGETLLPRMDVVTAVVRDATGTVQSSVLDPVGPFSLLYADSGTGWTVELDYGFRSPPAKVADVAKLYCRYLLYNEKSGVPERATSYQPVEGGTYSIATPGIGKSKTGIPDVDRVLDDYTLRIINDIGLL